MVRPRILESCSTKEDPGWGEYSGFHSDIRNEKKNLSGRAAKKREKVERTWVPTPNDPSSMTVFCLAGRLKWVWEGFRDDLVEELPEAVDDGEFPSSGSTAEARAS